MPDEDRLHARAIARQLLEPAAQLLHRRVEHARHGAELVARRSRTAARVRSPARVARARRRRSPARGGRAAPTTATPASSATGTAAAERERASRCRTRRELRVDVGQRQRHADVARPRDAMRRHGDVQHVGRRPSCCSARRCRRRRSRAGGDLRAAAAWFSSAASCSRRRASSRRRTRPSAATSVTRPSTNCAEPIGFVVERRAVERRRSRESSSAMRRAWSVRRRSMTRAPAPRSCHDSDAPSRSASDTPPRQRRRRRPWCGIALRASTEPRAGSRSTSIRPRACNRTASR